MPFPKDRYTPHGYLDNPYHTRNLNPSGVIRSTPGIGFAWHYPALAGGYGAREIYRASLELALTLGETTRYRQGDFTDLHADYHSKNVVRFRWRTGRLWVAATFFLVDEHALACRVRFQQPAEPVYLRLTAFSRYTRHLGAAGGWGESGLVGRLEDATVVLQGFEDGEAFALGADVRPEAAGTAPELSAAFLRQPLVPDEGYVAVIGRRGEQVTLYGATAFDVTVEPGAPITVTVVLARGLRRELALQRRAKALGRQSRVLSVLVGEDEAFWSTAPRLEGDWPNYWRRGMVYDFETLRMMVRRPVGIYRHRWDAMQIQAPRVVLAEAAIDAMLLAYADPATAHELLLGTFLDALQVNVPCSREDGSYNMVSINGAECGTAPEWGYPLEVAQFLYDLDPQPSWLAAIYPRLAAYLKWWLEHRRDEEGYLVYDNSWESGQDLSPRFGPQEQGGGSTIRSVRPVDLQAAMAGACRVMKRFASLLEEPDEALLWGGLEQEFFARVENLWHDGAYRDYHAQVGWSDVRDVMQLVPVALRVALPERVAALRSVIEKLERDSYLWPMFVWTAVEAALAAGEPAVASRIAADTVDRAYRYWDAPVFEDGRPLPGISSEYWGTDGRCGGEGYGWGAFGIHLLLRVIVGFRPEEEGFSLTPNLPTELLLPSRSYAVRNLHYRGTPLELCYRVLGDGLEIELAAPAGGEWVVGGKRGNPLRFRAENRASYRARLSAG